MFGILSGLPSWVLVKMLTRDDFIHSLKFSVPASRIPGCMTGCCGCNVCKKSINAHDITFPDLLFAILHDKLSRSLLVKKFANFVSPGQTIEHFVVNHMPWHSTNDQHTIARAGRALGAMLGAVQATPSSCVASCCGLVPPNMTELDALKASIER